MPSNYALAAFLYLLSGKTKRNCNLKSQIDRIQSCYNMLNTICCIGRTVRCFGWLCCKASWPGIKIWGDAGPDNRHVISNMKHMRLKVDIFINSVTHRSRGKVILRAFQVQHNEPADHPLNFLSIIYLSISGGIYESI